MQADRLHSLLIGCALATAAPALAQDVEKFHLWALDDPALAAGLSRPASAEALRRAAARKELWEAAARHGPRIASLCARRVGGRDPSALSMIAALGLAGGPGASKILTRTIEAGRSPEARVFACLAAARANLRIPPRLLARIAMDSKVEDVVQAAARVALLCRGHGRELLRGLAASRSGDAYDRFWIALARALDASAPARALDVEGAGAARAASWARLERRALVLDACAHPGVLDAAALRNMVARADEVVLRQGASMALGRLGPGEGLGEAALDEMHALPELDRSCYFAGLETLDPSLKSVLARGPGGARDPAYRRRFRAAVVRLVPPSSVGPAIAELLGVDALDAQAGLVAALRRLLVDQVRVELSAESAGRLERAHGDLGILVAIASRLGSGDRARDPAQSEAARRRLTNPRLAKAVALLWAGKLGRDAADGARVLWRHFVVETGQPSMSGLGSPDAFVRRHFARLVRDYFTAAYVDRAASARRYLPAGIRLARKDYFEVLDQYLRAWPLDFVPR